MARDVKESGATLQAFSCHAIGVVIGLKIVSAQSWRPLRLGG